MNVKVKRKVLVPQYFQEFACIGSACEDSCCAGWTVNLDKETYKKYKKTTDQELSINTKISRNRSNPGEVNYGKIKMDSAARCSFLSEDNLCSIQMKYGEEYLSNTCNSYPRMFNLLNGDVEKAMTLSCPESARLILLNKDGISFDQNEEEITVRYFSKELYTKEKGLQSYFWEIRFFTIGLLQNRSYSLWERLLVLGLVMDKIQHATENGAPELITQIILDYNEQLKQDRYRNQLQAVPDALTIQLEMLKALVNIRFNQGIANKRYLTCLSEMTKGLGYDEKDLTEEEIIEIYSNVCKDYFEPFLSEHEYILENYLVNYVFKNLFPFDRSKVFDSYVKMIIHYSLIKIHMIGMSGYHKGLSLEKVIELIQSFSKTVEHHEGYINVIMDLFRKNHFNTMGYMAILIKN